MSNLDAKCECLCGKVHTCKSRQVVNDPSINVENNCSESAGEHYAIGSSLLISINSNFLQASSPYRTVNQIISEIRCDQMCGFEKDASGFNHLCIQRLYQKPVYQMHALSCVNNASKHDGKVSNHAGLTAKCVPLLHV